MARSSILATAVDRCQQIFSTTFNPAQNNVVQIPPRNVGLIKGFFVNITGTLNNSDSANASTLSDFNVANIIQQIQFTDLQNNIRIQTPGWHLVCVNALKSRRPYGLAFKNASTDYPVLFGANATAVVNNISPPPAASGSPLVNGTGTFSLWVYVPLAYSDRDLRGAIYANVLQATMQLTITVNTNNLSAAAGTDSTSTVLIGPVASSVSLNPVTITVFQHYLDQLPVAQNGQAVLPMIDLSTIYELKQTVLNAMVPGQDFPLPYSNFRDFIGTIAIFVHETAGTRDGDGADINYWALQSANFTNLWKYPPAMQFLKTRNHLGFDLPPGTYYFGSRNKPISTVQYGNMELIINPITANAGAYVLVAYEDFALMNTLSGAGSLAAS